MDSILFGIILTAQIAALLYLFRNNRVAKERHRIIDLIYALSLEDIKKGKDFNWRYEEFKTIGYTDMLLAFWKPVSSFYKNMDCIKPERRNT